MRRDENDVDDETMSGDNDVFNSNQGNNPSSLQVNSLILTILTSQKERS